MKIRYLPILAALFCLAGASLPERELPRKGKDFALFIAVNNYQNWDKLKHPISEVEKIAGELYRQYDFDTLVLRNPSQDQIVTALKQYNAKKYPDDGQLLIYLSGHGDFDKVTKEGFFIPREGRRNDATQTSYLSLNRLKGIVESIPCQHILLAIDACYAGTIDPSVAVRGEIDFGRPGSPLDDRNRFISRELQLRSRFIVTSSQKEQSPDASNFAAYFLRALLTGGSDHGVVTLQDLHAQLIYSQPKPHFTHFGDNQTGSNFLFIKSDYVPSKSPGSIVRPDPPIIDKPQPKQEPCAVNQTGDICLQNGRREEVWVNVNGQVRSILPGKKEWFYDVKAGTLNIKVTNYQPGGGFYVPGGLTTHQAKVIACSPETSVIR